MPGLTERERCAEYYAKNRDKKLKWMKDYYTRNKESIKLKARERYRARMRPVPLEEPPVVVAGLETAPPSLPPDSAAQP